MFITEREILTQTGFTVARTNVNMAQMMVETYTGRVEEDISDGTDKALMAQAVMYQAIYMEERPGDVLHQAEVHQIVQGDTSTKFNVEKFSPFMSPWSIKACERLSWNKSRSIKTGKVLQNTKFDHAYAWTHDIGVV
jgi:hypothetical protein